MAGFESQNAAERRVVEFLHSYKSAFEAFDAERVTDHFVCPVHVTSDADHVSVVSVPNREAWRTQIAGLIDAYRRIGVASAYPAEIRVHLMSPNVLVARVHWRLLRADQSVIYQFHGNYTVVVIDGDLKITAIVHDESARLREAMIGARSDAGK